MTLVKAHGVTFTIPDSWSYFTLSPRTWHDGVAGLSIHVANMAVPLDDDSGFASSTMGLLGPMDLGFVLQELLPDRVIKPGEGYFDAAKPSNLTAADFNEHRVQVIRAGQVGYLAPFTLSHRAFYFYAVLGSEAAAGLLPTLNAILDSIGMGPNRG